MKGGFGVQYLDSSPKIGYQLGKLKMMKFARFAIHVKVTAV